MPIVHIYYTEDIKNQIFPFAADILHTVQKGLDVPETSIEIIYLCSTYNQGKDIYVEIKCKNKDERTEEQYQLLMEGIKKIFNENGFLNIRIALFRFPPQDIMMIK